MRASYKWGETITTAYFPKENGAYFDNDLKLIDWLRQYSTEKDETFVRGFLGRMLFSGDESLKKVNVLSGGREGPLHALPDDALRRQRAHPRRADEPP